VALGFRNEKFRRARYHLVAFFSGAAVLVIEIVGARLLAPYLGASYLVWVNIIGVILAALALGYSLGGILADRTKTLLPFIFFAAAFFVVLIPLERHAVPILGENFGLRLGSLAAALLLFAPASTLLGMVSPYLIKLATADLGELGRSSGGIFAASTLGSIAATFATGFWLIPSFSVEHIVWGVAALLCILGLTLLGWKRSRKTIGVGLLVLVLSIVAATSVGGERKNLVFEKNSQYYNIRVVKRPLADGVYAYVLLLDGTTQGGAWVTDGTHSAVAAAAANRLLFPYITLSARLIDAVKPHPARMLAVGGGTYSIPEYVKRTYPESRVTVAEIDPEVTATARQFFIKADTGPIETVQTDGRVFLNRTIDRFDLIYTDAYNGAFTIPWHLSTREAFEAMSSALADNGVLVVNVASALTGENGQLFAAFWKTFSTVFPETAIFATDPANPALPQNVVLVAAKKPTPGLAAALSPFENSRYRGAIQTAGAPFLTDEHSPTDTLNEHLATTIYPMLKEFWE